ncbi:MAG: indolepyruvate ferredoxin oxidoreductase subunit alpha [Peptococcaceae bacterium]|jgi:indolepyruvate ferredoxin oxidoreductase alpha subunit|nr:indolepyruvate ferredoxin oxidoreductase subunit alpha [Peptococcaceae bacterium]
MPKVMSGNEAVAYGAYLAGVRVASGYPGTPSTEILENLVRYPGIATEWATNEKVGFDVAVGAAYAGARALVTMKHVGLNVAAESLFYSSYTGLTAGLVVVTADDPGMFSSQNEQDNRRYGQFAKVPVVEPSDSEEARRFTQEAFAISEQFDVPVLLRTTTRIAHSSSAVETVEGHPPRGRRDAPPSRRETPAWRSGDHAFPRDQQKYVMIPAYARMRHPVVEERLTRLAAYAETSGLNQVIPGDRELGIVTCGVAYQYAREVFPTASFLKLGLVYPLPAQLIRTFAAGVKRLIIVEELDPFLEEQIRLLGVEAEGKKFFSLTDEYTPDRLRNWAAQAGLAPVPEFPPVPGAALPGRPPMLCPGCGHRGVFYVLHKLKPVVMGDIGCYTLGAAPPLYAIHTCGCMGAGIGVAQGAERAGVKDKVVAVIGDSTFYHSGMAPLVNVLWNNSPVTTIILDNLVTAMTGHQVNPGSGATLQGEGLGMDLERMLRRMGFSLVDTVDPLDYETTLRVIKRHLETDAPTVVVARRPCALQTRFREAPYLIDPVACTSCGTCLKLGCVAVSKYGGTMSINQELCVGCGLCAAVCPQKAVKSSTGVAN